MVTRRWLTGSQHWLGNEVRLNIKAFPEKSVVSGNKYCSYISRILRMPFFCNVFEYVMLPDKYVETSILGSENSLRIKLHFFSRKIQVCQDKVIKKGSIHNAALVFTEKVRRRSILLGFGLTRADIFKGSRWELLQRWKACLLGLVLITADQLPAAKLACFESTGGKKMQESYRVFFLGDS